jgi:hypothetical protein
MSVKIRPNDDSAIVFSVYPIRVPRHGGQIRARELLRAYRSVFRKVTYIALCNSNVYLSNSRDSADIGSPPSLTKRIHDNPHLEALLIGMAAETDPELSHLILSAIKKDNPSTIILEQPFLGPAVFRIINEPEFQHISVIYSAHNIEDLLHVPLLQGHAGDDTTNLAVEWLVTAEKQAIEKSSAVISVSDSEATILRDRGAHSVIVTPNGGSRPQRASTRVRVRVERKLELAGLERYVLFVASAHQPNVDGFLSLVGSRLGFLPPSTGILIVGTISTLLDSEVTTTDPVGADLFGHRCFSWGPASDETLTALISRANAIILPITTGQGTNLKTPEALLSGKPVVGTTRAFRGFESSLSLSRVRVADDPQDFRREIIRSLQGQSIPLIPTIQAGRHTNIDDESEKLTWTYSRARLSTSLNQILHTRP